MTQDTQTPQQPQWQWAEDESLDMPAYVLQAPDGYRWYITKEFGHPDELLKRLTHLEGALREAEAMAALATELLDGNDPVENGEYEACCAWCGAEAIETDEYNAYQERVGEWMAPFRAQWDQTHRIQKPIGPHELGPASPWLYVPEHRGDCIWLRYRVLQQPKAGA